jgi:hypothetical protein
MKKIIFVILTSIIMTSCAVQFTSTMKKQLEDSNIDFSKIQFYNSQSFAFQREMSSSETGIEKGKIKTEEGKRIEIVKIPRRKPAICDSISGDKIFIIFEYGRDKRIPFVCDSNNKDYSLITAGSSDVPLEVKNYTNIGGYKFYGTINYEGKEYYYGYFTKPILKVKKSQMEKVLKESRTVGGIRIK